MYRIVHKYVDAVAALCELGTSYIETVLLAVPENKVSYCRFPVEILIQKLFFGERSKMRYFLCY